MCEELLVTVKAKNANKCRFGFPCSKLEQTELFTETNTRVLTEMELAKNDPYTLE